MNPNERLFSLDALRGFDMLFIMGFAGLVSSLCALWPNLFTDALAAQMHHVPWDGLTHHDTIFPLFLFIAGISFPVMAMHPVLQGLSLLFPLRHYFLIYVNSALNGWPLLAAWPFLLALLAFALLPVLLSRRIYRVTITMEYVP